MNKPDLLGCICHYDRTCTRNCRTDENKPYTPASDATLVQIKCDEEMNDPSSTACQRIEQEENSRPDQEVVGVEAWSNGLLRIWFQNAKYAKGRKRLLDESTTMEPATTAAIHANPNGFAVWFGPNDERNVAEKLEGDSNNTAPRAQLNALVRALELARDDEMLHIFSNAEYCVSNVNNRLKKWADAKFAGLANDDLWQRIHTLLQQRHVVMVKVKDGHSDFVMAKALLSKLLSK